MISYQYVNDITYIRMYKYFHNNHASFLDFSNGYDNMVKSCQQVRSYQSIFLKPYNSYFSMSLMDLKKWGGMYDSYENVSKRFRTFTYFVRTFLTYLSMDLGSTRNIERSVSSNHLPDRLVLVIHGAV